MKKPLVMNPSIEFVCPPFKVLKQRVRFPNLVEDDYYSVFKGAINQYVSIIGLDDKENVILINQWRPTTNVWELSLPMGGVENGETPLQAAKREFSEETGLLAKEWKKLGWFYESPGHSAQKGHVFLAKGIRSGAIQAKVLKEENIRIVVMRVTKLITLIKQHKFHDGSSLNALALFLVNDVK